MKTLEENIKKVHTSVMELELEVHGKRVSLLLISVTIILLLIYRFK